MSLTQSWVFAWAMFSMGLGMGLVLAAGRAPRPLYVVGTVIILAGSVVFVGDLFTLFPR